MKRDEQKNLSATKRENDVDAELHLKKSHKLVKKAAKIRKKMPNKNPKEKAEKKNPKEKAERKAKFEPKEKEKGATNPAQGPIN